MRRVPLYLACSLPLALLAASGCIFVSPTGYVAPTSAPAPSPDVEAVTAHLPYPAPIGDILPWSLAGRGIKRSIRSTMNGDSIYLGLGCTPQVDIAYAGTFPSLEARVTLNGQPWVSKTFSCASPERMRGGFTVDMPRWSPPDTGTYVFAMTLDPNDRYTEVDESNNSDTLIVRALPGNLAAGRIEFQLATGEAVPGNTVHVGTPVRVLLRSSCLGGYPSYRMRLEQDREVLLDRVTSCVSHMYPEPSDAELGWMAVGPGTHTFTLSLDPDRETRESDRADDTVSASLVVLP